MPRPPFTSGSVTLLTLVFSGIFFAVLTALASYVFVQSRAENAAGARTKAFSVAEAGLEYYRWHLMHFPNDLQNGTGAPGPYAINIPDPSGGTAGTATLAIAANTSCNLMTSIDITSVGRAANDASQPQTVVARYSRPSIAAYSYIVNDNVWAGADRVINGPYHSNGGVRMDGTANAPVTSSVSAWVCTLSFGCNPDANKPGVFGAGTNQNLWNYPTPQLDFAGIAANFSSLKTTAQGSGIYLQRYSSGNSNSAAYHKGYHLIFNANGTMTVKRVTSAMKLTIAAALNGSDPNYDYALISNETSYNTYAILASCGLIFVEDNTWIEGTIPSKVTVVVANVANSGVVPDAFLNGNIVYGSADGTDGLTLISQHNILIVPNSPQTMTLDGIFVAQGGAFGRNLYSCSSGGSYEPRTSLTILGSTISNKRTGTKWTCGNGFSAGYQTRIDSFDRAQVNDPPPFTPTTSSDYRFVDWRQTR